MINNTVKSTLANQNEHGQFPRYQILYERCHITHNDKYSQLSLIGPPLIRQPSQQTQIVKEPNSYIAIYCALPLQLDNLAI